jgi:hypothetical protein
MWLYVPSLALRNRYCIALEKYTGSTTGRGLLPPSPPWRWRQHGPLNHWYPTTTLYGVTTQWRWRQQGPPKLLYPTTWLHCVTIQWRWTQEGPSKRWLPTTTLHGVTTHKTLDLKHHHRERLKTRINCELVRNCFILFVIMAVGLWMPWNHGTACCSGNTVDLYSGNAWFESPQGYRLSWQTN